jgi:hypothetical protein
LFESDKGGYVVTVYDIVSEKHKMLKRFREYENALIYAKDINNDYKIR